MKISKITAVGRPIDPDYPTNRAIALLTVAVLIGGTVFQLFSGMDWVQSLLWGLGAGLTLFLAWALGREMDPDNDLSAFVAVGLALVGGLLWGLPGLGELFWLLLVVRILNRTPGLPPTVLDSLAVVGFGGWLSFQRHWGYGVVTMLGLLLDSLLPPQRMHQLLFAALSAVVTAIAGVVGTTEDGAGVSMAAVGIGLGLSAVFLPVVIRSREVESKADQTDERLRPIRVQAGQLVALLAGVGAALWGGMEGLVRLMPMWAATTGAAIYGLFLVLGRGVGREGE